MTELDPMNFEIGFDEFDLELLPANSRAAGSPAFRSAVIAYYNDEFRDLRGRVSVSFGDDRIFVSWSPAKDDGPLADQALERLERGDLRGAVPILKALVAVEPKNSMAHYNLGMALSDLGVFDVAQLHLLKAVHLDPENVNALVALGVALYRAGDAEAARRRLEQALRLDPANGYAHRNLAAILGAIGERPVAIDHLREAHKLLPDDQASAFGLARALELAGDEIELEEADALYQATIALNRSSEIAELAKQARSWIAQRHLRAAGGLRMDAVMYCLGALERFEQMTPDDVRGVGLEIAILGRNGIDVNNSGVDYSLRTIPGQFTGLHLMSLMYVAFKQVAPDYDIGFDLAQEYAAALQLYGSRKPS